MISRQCARCSATCGWKTTQIYAQIRPARLKRAVEFYEAKALDALGS